MPKFRNISPGDLVAFHPEGHPQARFVERGEVLEVPGSLVKSRPKPKDDEPAPEPLPDDAYIVAHNGEERAWPHAQWELVEEPRKSEKKTDEPSTVKEN